MIDYSESWIQLNKLLDQYHKKVLKNQFNDAVEIAKDIQIAAIKLQEWAVAQVDQNAT